jgi:hypothetical protein
MSRYNRGLYSEHSDRHRQHNSEYKKDTVFYNNGKVNILLRIGAIVPDGFVRGMLIDEKTREKRKNSALELSKSKKGTKYKKRKY